MVHGQASNRSLNLLPGFLSFATTLSPTRRSDVLVFLLRLAWYSPPVGRLPALNVGEPLQHRQIVKHVLGYQHKKICFSFNHQGVSVAEASHRRGTPTRNGKLKTTKVHCGAWPEKGRSRNRAGFLQQRRPLHGWVTNAPPPPARVRAFTAEWSAQFEEGESGIQGRASLPNRLCVVDLQLPAVELINGSPFSPGPPAVRPGRAAGARAEAVQGHAEPGGSSPGVPGHQQGSAGERGRPGRGGPDGEHLHNKQSPGSGPGGLGGHQPKRTSRPARGTLTGFKNKLGDPKSSVGNKLRVYQP
ncbi:hypothetical protein NDU88_003960 [Pleurodeles waltl]|uniref:Uncharacterized protein n=1 Tax=Pleurodeles waltl TaxID=8319 RepID=A0AAV7PDQ0_PLEWA|nr:hypothetical protein NDU88_003960 [Pleurodeles waltl]